MLWKGLCTVGQAFRETAFTFPQVVQGRLPQALIIKQILKPMP